MTNTTQLNYQRRQQAVRFFVQPLEGAPDLEMMEIPAGVFVMGSPEDEPERLDREGPQHEVTLQQFFMGKYPVRQDQWRFVAGLPQVERELKPNPSRFEGESRPVESVSWYDAQEFCARLSAYTGLSYGLPTEAEWEYACRAGTTTPFHFGDTITTDVANYRGTDDESLGWSGSYREGPKGEYREETTPVDQFKHANAFGLCDMHGNVWEWCEDHYHSSYEGAPTDGSTWIDEDAEENAFRVLRGGSWLCIPRYCRSAYRDSYFPRVTINSIGFRVVCRLPRILP